MAKVKQIFTYLLGFVMFLGVMFLADGTMAHAQETIRVAYPIQKGFTDINEDGEYTGYTYEYLNEIAQYTGWSYEFVRVEGTEEEQLTQLTEMVQSKEVDLIGAMMYSEQLDERYNYSRYSYGTVETQLQVPADSREEVVIDASETQQLRVAVTAATGRMVDDLAEFSSMNLLETELIQCNDDKGMMAAVREGRADAMLNTSMNFAENVRVIAQFAPRQFYFVTAENNDTTLLSRLNEAMNSLYQTDPNFQTSLYEKYFSVQSNELLLSEAEEDYIKNAGTLKVGVQINRQPYQYLDEKDNRLKGIGVDLLNQISERTGLSFTLVQAKTGQELFEMAEEGKIDIVAGMPYEYEFASENKLSMTRPYIYASRVLLLNQDTSQDDLAKKRMAYIKDSGTEKGFEGKKVECNSVDACIDAVNEGNADYTYVDIYSAQYYINQPDFAQLKLVPQADEAERISFGLTSPIDPTLLSIFNKAILTTGEKKMQNIIDMNTLQNQEYSIQNLVKKNPVQSVVAVAVIFLLVFLLLLWVLHQRSETSKAAKLELERHLKLYAVSNDCIFEYDYKNKSFMLNVPISRNPKQKIMYYNVESFMDADQADESRESAKSLLELLENHENGVFERRLYGLGGEWHTYRIVIEKTHDDLNNLVYAIGRLNEIDEEYDKRENLKRQAQRDSLTGLYNNASSQHRIKESLKLLEEEEKGALLVLDVDYFKIINDTYGHARGDQVLQVIARLLQDSFRKSDIVARQGGDEFMVYMSHIQDVEFLKEKCASVCQEVRDMHIDEISNLTVSMGVVIAKAGQEFDGLFGAADTALYDVKAAGRDNYKIVG